MESTMSSKERWRCFSFHSGQLAEFGMHPVSLKFAEAAKEKGYADAVTARLARIVRNYMALWFFFLSFKILFDMTISYDVGTQDPDVYFEAKVASASVDMFILIIGTSLLLSAHLTLRRGTLSLRQLEGLFIVVLMTMLLVGPLVPLRHARRVLLRREDVAFADDFDAEVMVTLLFDIITTMVSLTPARFSSIWMIYLFAIVWYPASRLLLVGSTLHPKAFLVQTTVVVTLTGMAMAGKVMMEVQERRLFHVVANERTMRAESEFRLAQQDFTPGKRKSASRSDLSVTAVSCDTASLFDSPSGSDAMDVQAKLKRIKTLARNEHWLIEAKEVQLTVSKILGCGGFGAVVGGFMRGLPVAVKVSLEKMGSEGLDRISSLIGELRVLRQLRHPSIVAFYGAIVDPETSNVAAVLEFASGPSLTDFIQMSKSPLPEEQSYRISGSTASALQYLHGHRPAIVHGDLKPSNIMVELSGVAVFRVKLVDFGLSRILKGQVNSLGGTLSWKAPELLTGKPVMPTPSVDVYGLGRIMLFVLSGVYPFLGWNKPDIREALLAGKVPGTEAPSEASQVHMDLWKLGKFCSSSRPSMRPPTEQVCWQLRGLGTLPSTLEDLGAASREIWGWRDLNTKDPLEPWDKAMPKLRQMLRQSAQERADGRGDAPATPAPPAPHAASSSSSSALVASPAGRSALAEGQDSSRDATKLSPIIECTESKQGSRTPQSSTSNSGEAATQEANFNPDMKAAFAQVFSDRLAL